jgi:hypothetical protein
MFHVKHWKKGENHVSHETKHMRAMTLRICD